MKLAHLIEEDNNHLFQRRNYFMNSKMAMVRLLQKLFKKTARQSKAFDLYQNEFLKKLHVNSSEQTARQLFNECIKKLNEYEIPLEDTLSEGRLIAAQSQLQLKKINNLSEYSQDKINKIKETKAPYSIIEFHNELTSIIKIYQRVVIELNKIPLSSENKPYQCEDACFELQQLLLNLDIGEAYVKPLDEIRQKIATLDSPLKLPEYCISIIATIIDSTREERRSSRNFLYTLNDSLTQFYINFEKSVKNAEDTFDDQELCIKTLQRNSARLKNKAEQAIDMESLRSNIFAYVESVEQLISTKEKEHKQEVHSQLQSMIREIKELQSETKSYQKTLKRQKNQLHIDFLTKIPNRAAWSERLELEYNRCQRYKNPLNIAIIDIDNFKKINDTFGHLAGDKVLNVVAQTLHKSLRTVDFIARYGGEEFTVLLPEVNQEQMHIALEKLRRQVKNIPFKFKKENISITVSIGCTLFLAEDEIESAFERADRALYHAKRNGRDKVVYFAG